MRVRSCHGLLAAFALCLGMGCAKRSRQAEATALPPLEAPSWLVSLVVPGFEAARVAVPLGARTPRPLAVALHGDADRPEWACGSYRSAAGSRAFVLCPTGVPLGDGRFGLGPAERGTNELRAALPALKARFGKHLARGAIVLAALGPSAETAYELALKEPSFFAHLILVDAPLERLDVAFASRFGAAGGRSVLVVCGEGTCGDAAEQRVRALLPAGVNAKLVRHPGRGLDATAAATIAKEWPWLVAKDSRFR